MKDFLEILRFLIKNFEKALRIIAPGFLIIIVFFWNKDFRQTFENISTVNINLLLITIVILGMVFYSIHRTLFSLIDLFGIKKRKVRTMDTAIKSFKIEHKESLQQNFYVFNAIIHLSSMFYELIIISFVFKIIPISFSYFMIAIFFLAINIFIKIFETRLEYNIKIADDDT